MADDGEAGGGIVGFLFGNVNEKGELEDDGLLDADSRRQIGQLHNVLGSYIGDLESEDGSHDDTPPVLEEKAANAVDYGDIEELCDEQTRSHDVRTAMSLVRQSDHKVSPLAALRPPTADVTPVATSAVKTADNDDDDYDDYDTPSSQPTATVGQVSGPSPTSFLQPPLQPVASSSSPLSAAVASSSSPDNSLEAISSAASTGKSIDGVQAGSPSSAAKVNIVPKSSFIPARLSSLSPTPMQVPASSASVHAVNSGPITDIRSVSPVLTEPKMASPAALTVSDPSARDELQITLSSSDMPMDTDRQDSVFENTPGVFIQEGPQRSREEVLALARKYYPEFHPDKVIRFSRLFGPGRASSIPRTWKDVVKPRKRRHLSLSRSQTDESQSEEETPERKPSEDNVPKPAYNVWKDACGRLHYGRLATEDEKQPSEEGHFLRSTIRGAATKRLNFDNSHQHNGMPSESDRINKLLDAAAWRHGPAGLVYDMLSVPEDAISLDNTPAAAPLKKKKPAESRPPAQAPNGAATLPKENGLVAENGEAPLPLSPSQILKEDAFSMVTQVAWEDEIIWKDEDIVARGGLKISNVTHSHPGLQAALQRRNSAPGSISTPTWKSRAPSFQPRQSSSSSGGGTNGNGASGNTPAENEKKEGWFSLFPIDNQDLMEDDWMKDIIWDSDNVQGPLAPTVMKLNCNDDNLYLGIPEDVAVAEDPATLHSGKKETKKNKTYGMKKDKAAEDVQTSEPQVAKDPFNLSNDEFYSPQLNLQDTTGPTTSTTRLTVQHSTPALELHQACFPTHMSIYELRSFHRHPLKLLQRGVLAGLGFKAITSVTKQMRKKAKEREKERAASGGGEVFFMRSLEDLSCLDGDMVLLESSEEHPPLILQRGMAGKLITYYKRKPVNDPGPPKYNFGETVYVQQSPFLGSLAPGQALQGLECSLYRVPVYEHRSHSTDFIVIRTQDHYYIREYNGLFVMGQECPKIEVPGPNSKRAGEHIREFLKVFIFRLFRKSQDYPRRIKMETIRKAFPSHSESSVRKRLKLCADFKRTGAGNDCGWWVLKEDFQLPSEEKMRSLMTPENCAAFYSMLAAEQRLKDAGFGGKSMFAEEDEEDNQNIDDEIYTAPWHTTRNFVAASKGKCQLAVFGNADPTGCGEGFSYARVPNKPMQGKEEGANPSPVQQKKAVTGTDADLRRLSLKNAREVMKKDFGYTEEELNKLGRWAVINALRTHSTQAAKEGKDGMKNSKFARGSRFSMAEHQERYREDCQRIFDIQNRVLASEEVLSTDEGSSSEDEGRNLDKLASGLDNFLTSSKSTSQLTYEQEEAERRKLQDLLEKDTSKEKDKDKDKEKEKDKTDKNDKRKDGDTNSLSKQDGDDTSVGSSEEQPWMHVSGKNRRLLIHRTFQEDGKMFVRTEIVTHPDVIDAYLRVAGKKDKSVYAEHDEHTREAMRREKRRIQEQLRRIKRNEEKERVRAERRRIKQEAKELNPNLAKMRCGACGGFGHMKTNKHCPKYIAKNEPAMSVMEDTLSPVEEPHFPQDHLVKVEGTKISFDKSILEHTNRMRSLKMTIPIMKKRRRQPSEHCDYLQRHTKTTHRRRTNPVVDMGNIFEKQVLEKMRQVPDSYPFHVAVPPKQAPDYNKIVKEPMHLQLMKDNIRDGLYRSREELMAHVDLMVQNSLLYNGKGSPLTRIAENMREAAHAELVKCESQLAEVERQINPLLSDDPMVTLCHHLEVATQRMKTVPDSWPFYLPVQVKDVPDYYSIIKHPMDLQTLAKHCQEHYFRSREEFMKEVQLLYENSLKYNGGESQYTQTAQRLVKAAEDSLAEVSDKLESLEMEIGSDHTPLSSIANSPAPGSAGLSFEDPLGMTDSDMLSKHDIFNKPISLADYHIDSDLAGVGLRSAPGTNYNQLLLQDLEASSGDDEDDDDDEMDMGEP